MNRRTVSWVLMVIALSCGVYFLIRLEAARKDTGIACSTRNAGRDGYKAAFLFLKECGVRVSRRQESWLDNLPPHGLLVVAGPRHQPSTSERGALRRWISEGGTALIVDREPWHLWPVGGRRSFGSSLLTSFRPLVPTGLTADLPFLRLIAFWRRRGPFVHPGASRPPVVLAGDTFGGAILLATHGKGRIILASDAGFIDNGRLRTAPDNGLFLLNVARSFGITTVQFDEYHLGFGYRPDDPGILARLPSTLRVVWWQLLFLAMIYFCSIGKRLGRPIALPETGGRTITEYISSVATLYQRAQAGSVALEHLYHGLVERMRLATGLPATVGHEILVNTVARRLGVDPGGLYQLLAGCQAALGRERVSPAELFVLAKRIDHYRKELDKWVTSPR